MERFDFVFANKSWELNRWVLILSVLGILAKVVHIDVSHLAVFGLSISEERSALIPGFIGIALYYCLGALVLSRGEMYLAYLERQETEKTHGYEAKGCFQIFIACFFGLFSMCFYTVIPFLVGFYAIYYLWSDSMGVFKIIFGS